MFQRHYWTSQHESSHPSAPAAMWTLAKAHLQRRLVVPLGHKRDLHSAGSIAVAGTWTPLGPTRSVTWMPHREDEGSKNGIHILDAGNERPRPQPGPQPGRWVLSHGEIRTIVFGLMLAMFLAALNQTIVATALPTIGRDFRDFELLPWIVTAYLLSSTVVAPLYGKL